MLQIAKEATAAGDNGQAPDPVVIVGGGPAGIRVAQELSRKGIDTVLFNAERWLPYNRVKLSTLLAGEAQIGQVYTNADMPGPGKITRYDGVSITDIDPERKQILASNRRIFTYDKLVLALGSRAFVPSIPGADLPGVYTFRNFDDAEALTARSNSARHVVVIGGGLLGLEAARGMRMHGASVTVVEHENRLMPRQLDLAAGDLLKSRIEALDVSVLTSERVSSIDGEARVSAVSLASGLEIEADTVIICTGVRANIQLAEAIGLNHGRAIRVNDQMQTENENIYAVGECAEHGGIVHGLVGPVYEQAIVAASTIAGEALSYEGSIPATKLKVLGADVFSMGDFENLEQRADIKSEIFIDPETGNYRRIFMDRNRLVAAIGVGEWPEASKLQQAVARKEQVGFLSARRFQKTGFVWKEEEDGIASWPREAIVCNCTGVTKGALQDAGLQGAKSLDDFRSMTGASTVCGTCQPLVLELSGSLDSKVEAARWWKALLGLSGFAILAALVTLLLPPVPLSDGFVVKEVARSLWFDTIWKQWSGFSLLGITLAAALLGLRRRISWMEKLGSWDHWRILHIAIGMIAALVLIWHTGFRLGANLNLLLMVSFVGTLVMGAVTGAITGGEHELRNRDLVGSTAKPRSLPTWLHILLLWPLPVLLILHILIVYTY